ncbi:actin interacting protein 3-domain-containing protein [Gilbertella persicaria]|uniref:actin interacting protein 3-domain-containing protein n=1 Tax=Gilbertella persicaria TaxID=101096 RepID=UPI00221E5BE1|nr:actin interacting protein 3-domain-containing protein [Gilbertella persicaria]KAI8048952.1 actin interacting protein 3-domain-containing protein [Gilbertella persicaria]
MHYLPEELRTCLKEVLEKEPSLTTLEQHLPAIRDIIMRLLQGLKAKQSLLRDKEFPVYLKSGDRIKKCTLQNSHLSIASIQQLFMTTFDVDLSTVYILDPTTNIEYELEDVQDIQPYSVLSIKATHHTLQQLHSLFDDFLQQSAHTLTKETELNQLKQELTQLKQSYAQLKTEHDASDNRKIHQEISKSKDITQKAATLMTTRLEELQDTIDQLKSDVTQRRCRPSKHQLTQCQQVSDRLMHEMKQLESRIKTCKPLWKKTWELELQQIVKEQQFLKEQEALVADLKEDHKALIDVLGQLHKISEIQERKKQLGMPIQKEQDEEEEGMIKVLQQVSHLHVDHHQRMKALGEIETKIKSKKQTVDEFERELTDFIGFSKLKNIGGTENVDKQRQEKDKAMIQQLFTHKQ